jgi:hypothetical protein
MLAPFHVTAGTNTVDAAQLGTKTLQARTRSKAPLKQRNSLLLDIRHGLHYIPTQVLEQARVCKIEDQHPTHRAQPIVLQRHSLLRYVRHGVHSKAAVTVDWLLTATVAATPGRNEGQIPGGALAVSPAVVGVQFASARKLSQHQSDEKSNEAIVVFASTAMGNAGFGSAHFKSKSASPT